MTKEQFKRANSAVYPIILIVYAYVVILLGLFCLTSGGIPVTYVQIGVSFLTIIVSTVVFIKMKETKLCGDIMVYTAVGAYVIMVLASNTPETFAYAYPILFGAIAYLNKKMVLVGNIEILAANVIKLILKSGDKANSQAYFLAVFISTIIFIASLQIVKLLIKNNEENLSTIQKAADEQAEKADKIREIAAEISSLFEDAMQTTERLDKSVDTSNFAMSNIADSTESTAEAIQDQATMCTEIQQKTDIADKETKTMLEASETTASDIKEGVSIVGELKQQAHNVEVASNVTVEVMKSLVQKVADVENFVGAILNISNQTNLLALNASIEAARAGEAGKGFAVVADQIRQLSEQTKDASNSITNIIEELNGDTQKAEESVANSVESVEKQNELIDATQDTFTKIKGGVEELTRSISNTGDVMKDIVKSTNVISDSISQLSASSEEVSASATEGLRTSQSTVDDMKDCKEILEKIFELSKQL